MDVATFILEQCAAWETQVWAAGGDFGELRKIKAIKELVTRAQQKRLGDEDVVLRMLAQMWITSSSFKTEWLLDD